CGGIFWCFFSGFVNTFLNGNGETGLAQLGGSLALGVVAVLGGGGSSVVETTTLYRAVSDEELASILANGGYSASPFGGDVKYFYPSAGQADQFVQNGWASTVTSVEVPTSLVNGSYTGVVAGEGPVVAIANTSLPGLG